MEADSGTERIRVFGSMVLRQTAVALPPGTDQTKTVLDSLWDVLQADGGVGLAAPQIGIAGRACVIRKPESSGAEERLDLVNPVLKKTFGPREVFEEGCLSFPGLYFDVVRSQGMVVEFHDAQGSLQRIKDSGLLARIIQHELDHLDGVLYIDRIPTWQRLWLVPRLVWIAVAGFLARKWSNK